MSESEDVRYTRDHEWIGGDTPASVGITDYAQRQLGDIVYVDLPAEGDTVKAGEVLAEVESTKNVAQIFAPVTGTVAEVNGTLEDDPAVINESPLDEGWIVRLTVAEGEDLDELLTPDEYEEFCSGLGEGELGTDSASGASEDPGFQVVDAEQDASRNAEPEGDD